MRSFIIKGSMIAAAALAISACAKTETTNTVSEMNTTVPETMNDTMTAPDAGAMNGGDTMANDTMTANTTGNAM